MYALIQKRGQCHWIIKGENFTQPRTELQMAVRVQVWTIHRSLKVQKAACTRHLVKWDLFQCPEGESNETNSYLFSCITSKF